MNQYFTTGEFAKLWGVKSRPFFITMRLEFLNQRLKSLMVTVTIVINSLKFLGDFGIKGNGNVTARN